MWKARPGRGRGRAARRLRRRTCVPEPWERAMTGTGSIPERREWKAGGQPHDSSVLARRGSCPTSNWKVINLGHFQNEVSGVGVPVELGRKDAE